MDPVVPDGAQVLPQPRGQVLRDPGAHRGHSARHMAAQTHGGHQETGGPCGRDRHLQDRHHLQLPQTDGP